MNIGQAAQYSGVSSKMIRHYEDIGLIKKAGRSTSGYRVYSENDLHILAFVRQARNLGFSIEQIRELLDLWQNKKRTSRKVKELALKHIQELNVRIKELKDIQQAISQLVKNCHGDDRPECPIIDSLTNPVQQLGHTGKKRKFGLKN